MKIKHFTTKDISFSPEEREKVTRHVIRLLLNGWEFVDGDIDEETGLVDGNISVDGKMIEIQLNRCF